MSVAGSPTGAGRRTKLADHGEDGGVGGDAETDGEDDGKDETGGSG